MISDGWYSGSLPIVWYDNGGWCLPMIVYASGLNGASGLNKLG